MPLTSSFTGCVDLNLPNTNEAIFALKFTWEVFSDDFICLERKTARFQNVALTFYQQLIYHINLL